MTNLVRHCQRGLYSLDANVLAGFQHREPTRQPDDEGRQPVDESHRDRDDVLPTRSYYRGAYLCHSVTAIGLTT